MHKIIILFISLIFAGCTFGEYADSNSTTTSTTDATGTTYYKFTQSGIENNTLYRVYKPDENWSMIEYDFNDTSYEANQIEGGSGTSSGTYSITDDGYLKLISMEVITYIKAIKEDSEKISLLWTNDEDDLSQTTATKNTYFFKTKEKADEFIE